MIIDYAKFTNKDHWLRHPVCGDPSFDTFVHDEINPIHTGSEPYNWPVNGTIFKDPISNSIGNNSNYYIYVGHYYTGYARNSENKKGSNCTVYKSDDNMKTWQHMGEVFDDDEFYFENYVSNVHSNPDVFVIYEDGKYHMIYDWALKAFTWDNAHEKNKRGYNDSGFAYAVADSPEGPFIRNNKPVWTNADYNDSMGKYDRLYATSFHKRKDDYMFFILADSGEHFGWSLFVITGKTLEGPFSEPKCILSCEGDNYHPPLMEFFPIFIKDDYVYAPATSVAGNRNFQMIWRAPIEKSTDANSWEIYMHGSIWHSEYLENEYSGIWGQTFSALVDDEENMKVMFPSKNKDNVGTINIASREFNSPYKDSFVFSGHIKPSITLLNNSYKDFVLNCNFDLNGTVNFLWGHNGAIQLKSPTSDTGVDEKYALSSCYCIEITDDTYKLCFMDEFGTRSIIFNNTIDEKINNIKLNIKDNVLSLVLNNIKCWQGKVKSVLGSMGLFAHMNSNIKVDKFEIDGQLYDGMITLMYNEAVLSAAQLMADYNKVTDKAFRYGHGVISKSYDVRLKINFIGTGIKIWSPTGTDYGKADIFLDGKKIDIIDFHSQENKQSSILKEIENLENTFHTLVIKPCEGNIPVDSFDIIS